MKNIEELKQELLRRKLPAVWPAEIPAGAASAEAVRKRNLEILRHSLIGETPEGLTGHTEIESREEDACGGKGFRLCMRTDISAGTEKGTVSFRWTVQIPYGSEPFPVFLRYTFTQPEYGGISELILDRGYAIADVPYQEIVPDTYDNFSGGLAALCPRDPETGWGKVGMWAYAGSIVMDALETVPEIDAKRTAVIGHSRLGKTALWAGASDGRFSLVCSIQSGCGGAALFRGKKGERISDLGRPIVTSLWYCGNLYRYAGREEELPFDQHFLISAAAPRRVYVSSAIRDDWSDPESELLGAMAASEVYEKLGLPGLVLPEKGEIKPDTGYHDGYIGYHVRTGTHYFGWKDWQLVMDYRDRHSC